MQVISNFVIRFAKPIIAIWTLLFVLFSFFAFQLPTKLEGDGFFYNGDHHYVKNELSDHFGLPADNIFVLFENKTDTEIKNILTKLATIKEVHSINSPFEDPSMKSNSAAYAQLNFDRSATNVSDVVNSVRTITGDIEGVSITGAPVFSNDINNACQKDLAKAETIGLPIALIVLLLAFGTFVSSLLPIIIGAATVVIALGILSTLADRIDLSIFVLNIVPMLGLALSIDFALLFINRFREERGNNNSTEQSVKTAIETAGRSILFSALCVIIGLGAMVVIRVQIFQNIALGGTIVVALAVLTGLTLLPATIYLLGDHLNKWRLLRVRNTASRWQKFASFVIKHPIKVIIVALLLFAIALIPIKDIKLTIPSTDSLPPTYESRSTFDKLQAQFRIGKEGQLFLLAEQEQAWASEQGFQKLFLIQKEIEEMPLVTSIRSPFTTAKIDSIEEWNAIFAQSPQTLQPAITPFVNNHQSYLIINIAAESASSEAQDFVRKLDETDLGVDFKLAGLPKFNQEIFDEILGGIGYAILIIIIATFIILMIAFRSILIPLKAIIMNILGLASTFGILVYIFQYGHFGLPEGTIVLIIPVIVFCLVFGLSMDYEVFLISRIQEEYEAGATNTQATIDGLVSTSKIITSAALIMIVITGAFAFTDVMPVKQIGVGIAIAIAIDATIIRLMLVPSLMKLFGEWNWWLPFKKSMK